MINTEPRIILYGNAGRHVHSDNIHKMTRSLDFHILVKTSVPHWVFSFTLLRIKYDTK